MIKIIVAVGKNNEIGIGDQLLGHYPEDLKHFKYTTRGQIVLVGRKTFDGFSEFMKGLPSRFGIVLTSRPEEIARYLGKNVGHSNSLAKVVNAYVTQTPKDVDLYICGGETVYKEAIDMPEVQELIVTYIDKEFPEATHFFPEISLNTWHETEAWALTDELMVIRYVRK